MANELLRSFLHMSLATSFVIALLLLAVPLLKKNYQAKWRYYAWLVIALRLLIPLNITLPEAPIQIQVPETAIVSVTQPGRSTTDQTLPVLDESYVTAKPDIQTTKEVSPAQIVMLVWISGAALFFLLQITAYIRFRRRVHYTPRTEPPALMQSKWTVPAELLGKKRMPELQISAAVSSPVITGLLKPVLLLPHDQFSEQELSFIFRHELVHYQRRDLWYKMILTIANGLHWFNPFVYLMVARAGMDIEISCDDQVMKGLDDNARAIYGEAILDALPIKTKWSIEPMLTTSFSRTKCTIKQRLTNLFDTTHKRKGIATFCAMMLVTGLIGGLIAYTPVAAAATTKAEVINLPNELSIPANRLTTGATYYDFTVEESTELAVDITTESGTIALRIYRFAEDTRSRDKMTLCLSVLNTEMEGDSVILEPGDYTVKAEAEQFTGEYRIFGADRESDVLPASLINSYYLSENDPVYSYLQNNSIKKFLDMWFAENIDKNVKPQWNYDTLAPVQILDHDFVSLTRSGVQLYTMTFSADGNRCGYILLSYSAEEPNIEKWSLTETTPYPYDLRANSEKIASSLRETNLDLSTTTAARIEWQDTKKNRGDRVILFQDGKGNRYICYLGNNDFDMEKV